VHLNQQQNVFAVSLALQDLNDNASDFATAGLVGVAGDAAGSTTARCRSFLFEPSTSSNKFETLFLY
jgi:hypothetical protein